MIGKRILELFPESWQIPKVLSQHFLNEVQFIINVIYNNISTYVNGEYKTLFSQGQDKICYLESDLH